MKLNQIFGEKQYEEVYKFAVENGYTIKEMSNVSPRRFQIIEAPLPTEQEIKANHIQELKQKLLNTDYQAIKFAEGLISEEEYITMKAQRQEWRDEINVLELEQGVQDGKAN